MTDTTKPFGTGRIIALLGTLAAIIGVFLPWGIVPGEPTITGLEGDGLIFIIPMSVIALVLLLIQKVPVWISLILGLLITAVGILDYNSMSQVAQDFAGLVTVGYGIHTVIAGGALTTIGTITQMVQNRK